MIIAIASKNPVKIQAALSAFSKVFKKDPDDIKALPFDVPSGVSEQPMSYQETREGAYNRVKNCMSYCQSKQNEISDSIDYNGIDYYIAYEGGVDMFDDGAKTFAVLCISNGSTSIFGQSASLPLPKKIYEELRAGAELGDAMDKLFSTHNIKQKGGAIGQLTSGLETKVPSIE